MNPRVAAQVRLDRGGRNAACDMCRLRPGTQIHHIVNKGRTQKNTEARELSEVKPLLALLCQTCHERAHNPASAALLLHFNARMYGREAVEEALAAVNAVLRNPIDVAF